MPESTLKWQSFNQKKPYFIATVFSLVAVVAAVGLLFDKLAAIKTESLEKLHQQVEPAQRKSEQFKQAYNNLKKAQTDLNQLADWMGDRYYWPDVMSELRQVLIRVEAGMKAKLRTDTGVWIDQFITAAPRVEGEFASSPEAAASPVSPMMPRMSTAEMEMFRRRYGLDRMPGGPMGPMMAPAPVAEGAAPPGADPAAGVDPATGGVAAPAKKKGNTTNEVVEITLTFRAVSMSKLSSAADTEIAYAVLNELQSSPLFDPKETTLSQTINPVEPPGTFTFGVTARLKRPLKL
jgi:hypothetical protein